MSQYTRTKPYRGVRRGILIFLWLLAAVSFGLGGCTQPAQPDNQASLPEVRERPPTESHKRASTPSGAKPNVIWILLDALRAENLSCYGYDRETSPNIDDLAARGALFEQHFTQGLSTLYSVPSYMTGQYIPTFCLDDARWEDMTRTAPATERLLPVMLKQHGYTTLLVSTHLGYFSRSSRLGRAFDEAVTLKANKGEVYAPFQRANEEVIFPWLESVAGKSFFLYVHLADTHFPHILEPPYDRWIDPDYTVPEYLKGSELGGMPTENRGLTFTPEDQKHLRALYDGDILYSDTHLGRLVECLRDLGMFENTIMVIGADHGEILGEDGTTWGHLGLSFDQAMRVPMILAGPGIPSGRRVTQLTENVDIVPTVLDLLDIEDAEAEIHGKSLVPVLRGAQEGPLHQYVFARYSHEHYDASAGFVLRDTRYKYEYYPDWDQGIEGLYAVPDDITGRTDKLREAPEIAARMREVLVREYIPLWERYKALSRHTPDFPFYFLFDGQHATPRDAVVELDAPQAGFETYTDNKWTIHKLKMWSSPWAEDAPEVTFRFEPPDGRYRVELKTFSHPKYYGHPASSLRVKVADDQAFRLVTTLDKDLKPGWHFMDLGEYDIRGQPFEITLDEGDRTCWAYASRLQFTPVAGTAPPVSETDRNAQEQALRALGYVD